MSDSVAARSETSLRRQDTIAHYFLAGYDAHPDRVLASWAEGSMSYREVLLRVAAIVERFQDLGIGRGDFVACYIEEQLPCLLMDLACALTGAVPVPLSPVFSLDYFLSGIVGRMDARAVMTTPPQLYEVARRGYRPLVIQGEPGPVFGFLPELESPDAIAASVEILGHRPSADESAARELLARTSHELTTDDIFMVQPTSGSTGQPKLALRRHRAFARYAHFVGCELAPAEGEPHRFLLVATLTHAFGLHMLTTAMRQGGSICIPRDLDTSASLDEVRELDPTVLPLLPRIQRSFFRQWRDRDVPIFGPSARYVCSAGGPASPEILEEFRRQGTDIIVFYGSTEASVMAVTPRQGWRPRHAGKIVGDADIRIADDGEIQALSPGLTPGYFDDDELTRQAFTEDGFYKTGDLGEIDEDGYLRILGRKRDVFNSAEGSNIYPQRIEQMLEAQPWAEQALLFGDGMPYLIALIALDGGDELGAEPGTLLSEEQAAAHYSLIRTHIARLNLGLERMERVVRFLLFAPPFSTEAYRLVGPGKVRRDREKAANVYAGPVADLYREDSPFGWLTFVPGADRRLRPRGEDSVVSTIHSIAALTAMKKP